MSEDNYEFQKLEGAYKEGKLIEFINIYNLYRRRLLHK
jgi:hypothetical protein